MAMVELVDAGRPGGGGAIDSAGIVDDFNQARLSLVEVCLYGRPVLRRLISQPVDANRADHGVKVYPW